MGSQPVHFPTYKCSVQNVAMSSSKVADTSDCSYVASIGAYLWCVVRTIIIPVRSTSCILYSENIIQSFASTVQHGSESRHYSPFAVLQGYRGRRSPHAVVLANPSSGNHGLPYVHGCYEVPSMPCLHGFPPKQEHDSCCRSLTPPIT
jgi:hypothetical protein